MTAACSNRIARTKSMIVTERMPVALERMFKQIAAVLPHVKGRVEIIEGDYTDAPDIKATWFVDPPYHVNGRPQQRGMGYAEGCNSDSLDYEALAKWCRRRRGQKIVCEQAGADWLPFEDLRLARNSIGNSATEVVWEAPIYRPSVNGHKGSVTPASARRATASSRMASASADRHLRRPGRER
jgi:hypothetical protein